VTVDKWRENEIFSIIDIAGPIHVATSLSFGVVLCIFQLVCDFAFWVGVLFRPLPRGSYFLHQMPGWYWGIMASDATTVSLLQQFARMLTNPDVAADKIVPSLDGAMAAIKKGEVEGARELSQALLPWARGTRSLTSDTRAKAIKCLLSLIKVARDVGSEGGHGLSEAEQRRVMGCVLEVVHECAGQPNLRMHPHKTTYQHAVFGVADDKHRRAIISDEQEV
jgi:hypothetical protein